ncbi:uncharacterized protein LOC111086307 [Limulus polyphemus]|uniref:Uncharacterized protein LOC111086307 n=1 Tax=Limulus polyphemus TaxID=6850 RepID=A0ABM1SL90_LIMPO|nr:uncharacterized protein LOC111086307 [Limulus polyphemus]
MNENDQLLQSKDFWNNFYKSVVVKQQWKSEIQADGDDKKWSQLKDNSDHWSILVYEACWELSHRIEGHGVMEFQRLGLKTVLMDYILHLHYFQLVASLMQQKGLGVDVKGHNNSNIHDIDKLDPLMLAGYTHRFVNNQETALWKSCLQSHLTNNPHHETHPIWHQDFCPQTSLLKNNCSHCKNEREKALIEMICDKVSRRVQKELQGKMDDKMWDIELYWFSQLPLQWQEHVDKILQQMKIR